jgi:hypothetical protein
MPPINALLLLLLLLLFNLLQKTTVALQHRYELFSKGPLHNTYLQKKFGLIITISI